MTTHSLFECGPFRINIQDKQYQSEGFSLNENEIICLSARAEFRAQDFLFLIAGLQNARNLTVPGDDNSLERKPIVYTLEELSFLRIRKKVNQGMVGLYELEKQQRARFIGFVYENPDTAIFGKTVRDDFFYSMSLLERNPNSTDLITYGLYEKIDRSTDVLSGGEKHRLICANAFERMPNIIIADFSFSNLDKKFLSSFLLLISDYVKKGGAAILHGLSPEEILLLDYPIKHLYCLDDGTITKDLQQDLQEDSDVIMNAKLSSRLQYNVKVNPNDPLLKVNDVYIEGRTKPISFDLDLNDILIIEGENGCGKTTLGKILTGQIKKTEVKGRFKFYKGNVKPIMSIQFPERSFLTWTIHDELPDDYLLRLCGIEERDWNQHPRQLNRAKQKLLSVASTLYFSNFLAILDEPTAGLDNNSKFKLIDVLNHFICDESAKSIIIFNHDTSISNIFRTIKII